MKLKLKKEYVGLTITKNHYLLGYITFNSEVDPKNYINFQKWGFDIFEEEYDEIIESVDKDIEENIIDLNLKVNKPVKKSKKNV
jgi:hypothetical protein